MFVSLQQVLQGHNQGKVLMLHVPTAHAELCMHVTCGYAAAHAG